MKNVLFTALVIIFSMTSVYAQVKEEKNEKEIKLKLEVKDGAEPDIYVDGKKFEFSMNLIDPDKIATVNVMKGKEALDVYNAPNGVILITTKEKSNQTQSSTLTIENYKNDHKVKETEIRIGANQPDPLIIIDGKTVSRKQLKELSPDDILTIDVIKDERAKEEYKSETGVIIVKTKKEAKEAKKE